MGPAPEHIHVKPIVDRIGELCSDRDEAVALTDGLRTRLQVARDALETERERSAALVKAVRAAQAKVNANARRVRTLETSRADVVKATAEAEAERAHAAQQRDRAVQAEAQVAELRAQAAELRARVAELEREARARPEPSPARPASIGVLSEVEQLAAADRITRSPRVVSALRGADVAALLRSGSPVAVALGRVSLGGAGELMDRAALVLGLATAWAKGVR
jgi:septal ring factor EnvC (AmiA/AmiB activator)